MNIEGGTLSSRLLWEQQPSAHWSNGTHKVSSFHVGQRLASLAAANLPVNAAVASQGHVLLWVTSSPEVL